MFLQRGGGVGMRYILGLLIGRLYQYKILLRNHFNISTLNTIIICVLIYVCTSESGHISVILVCVHKKKGFKKQGFEMKRKESAN